MLKVKNYSPLEESTSGVVAFVNFFIPEWGLHMNGCKLIRKKNGGFFVSYPSKKVEKDGAEPTYIPYFCFEKEKNDRFQSAAQKAIQEHLKTKQNTPNQEELPF